MIARPLRVEVPGGIYHVTSRGNAQQDIFLTDADRALFYRTVEKAVARYGVHVHAHCLMTNHYHLVLETPKPNLSSAMRHLNGVYAQSFNRQHRRSGHVLQQRYRAILVERDEYLIELCRYVVLNPVRAGLCGHPAEWRWSSYRSTAGLAASPEFLRNDWLLAQFGGDPELARQRYQNFVLQTDTSEPLEEVKGQVFLGDDEFVRTHAPSAGSLEIPRAQRLVLRPSLGELFADHGEWAICVSYRDFGYKLREIAEFLGVHSSTVSRKLSVLEESDA